MRVTRLVILATALLVLMVAVPANAVCIKCISDLCYDSIYGTNLNCTSYGTSCVLYGGTCGSGGLDCLPECVDGFGVATPLNREYLLSEVKIQQPKAVKQRIASKATTSASFARR